MKRFSETMESKIRRVGAECLQVAHTNLQVALVAGALLLVAISNDFHYMPAAMPASEVLMLILVIGSGPALLFGMLRGQSDLEQSIGRLTVSLLALSVLLYAWIEDQIDLLVAGALLIVQVAAMRCAARWIRVSEGNY